MSRRLTVGRWSSSSPLARQTIAVQIAFLIARQSKAAVVQEILAGGNSDAPAARTDPGDGKLTWLITEDAADDLGGA